VDNQKQIKKAKTPESDGSSKTIKGAMKPERRLPKKQYQVFWRRGLQERQNILQTYPDIRSHQI
jgi:hypothetical protein